MEGDVSPGEGCVDPPGAGGETKGSERGLMLPHVFVFANTNDPLFHFKTNPYLVPGHMLKKSRKCGMLILGIVFAFANKVPKSCVQLQLSSEYESLHFLGIIF